MRSSFVAEPSSQSKGIPISWGPLVLALNKDSELGYSSPVLGSTGSVWAFWGAHPPISLGYFGVKYFTSVQNKRSTWLLNPRLQFHGPVHKLVDFDLLQFDGFDGSCQLVNACPPAPILRCFPSRPSRPLLFAPAVLIQESAPCRPKHARDLKDTRYRKVCRKCSQALDLYPQAP